MEHYFNTNIAKTYGIEEAILLHHFYFWIAKNAANCKHFHDGLYWTYNSKKAYADFFTYMNETKIFRVIKHLEDEGFVVKGKYNKDKWDKTNWYAITQKGLELLKECGYEMQPFSTSLQNDIFDSGKMNDGTLQNEQSILINNTDKINTNSNKEENTNVFPKKNDYQAIVDCWNEYNGKSWGKVLRLSAKRKRIIKSALDNQGITQEELMRLFKTFPYADNWLFHPTKEHKDWKPDFDWWMRDTNGWLTKALEGKVHNANPQAFNEIMLNNDDEVLYTPQGRTIWFNEETKSYWSDDNFYYGVISDGYTDKDRPDGATLTMSNARGNIKWNANTKKWEKQ